MKTIFISLLMVLTIQINVAAQESFEIELDGYQSMIMTGKGTGQDATINPYFGEKCTAFVENIGGASFSIRVQEDGDIVKEIKLEKGKSKKIKLLGNYELYLDPLTKEGGKARISFLK